MKRTVDELAALLGVHVQIVRRWAKMPGFPRPTGRGVSGDPRRWSEDSVAAWLEGCAAADEFRFMKRATLKDTAAAERERRIEERRVLLAQIAALIDEGATYHEIAHQVGSTYWTVRKLAERNNLHRSPGARGGGAPRRYSVDDVLAALVTASEWAGRAVTHNDYARWQKTVQPQAPTATTITRRLGGVRWNEALRMAGLDAPDRPSPHVARWSDEEMLDAVAAAGAPSLNRYEAWRLNHRAPSATAIITRFGSWALARSLAADRQNGSAQAVTGAAPSGPK